MKEYDVTLTKTLVFTVEADSPDNAETLAVKEAEADSKAMHEGWVVVSTEEMARDDGCCHGYKRYIDCPVCKEPYLAGVQRGEQKAGL